MTDTPRHLVTEAQPCITSTAGVIHAALVAARGHDRIPSTVSLSVHVIGGARIVVELGGLTDEFIVGAIGCPPGLAYIDRADYTPDARRLHDEVTEFVRERLPRKESGELWHPFRVVLSTKGFWRVPFHAYEGVYLREGDR